MGCEGELFRLSDGGAGVTIVSIRVSDEDVRNLGVPRFGPCRLEAAYNKDDRICHSEEEGPNEEESPDKDD